MSKWLKALLFSVAVTLAVNQWVLAAEKAETEEEKARPPVITIGLQVTTPQGQPRTFARPGLPPATWNQTFPVIQGDRVQIAATVDTKGKKLGDVRLRLDNAVVCQGAKGPWQVDVDTATLKPGHHLIEVWADLASPDSGFRSATTSFLVVPTDDPLLQVLLPEFVASKAMLPKGNDKRLACSLGSANPAVAKALKGSGPVVLNQRTLLEVKAAKPATVYVYALSRDGRVTYVSPSMDLQTYVELVPKRLDPAGGLAAGEVELRAWAGDGKGNFGPPCQVTLQIK